MVIERIGQQFGSYRLVHFLGQGGFAEVYLGEHIHLKSQVAVKVLHTRLIAHQQEQFLREAHTIASLNHPGIVRILDCGVERGIPFLIMTYAPHGSLRQLYPEGACLPISDILSYVRPIASVLTYAHEHKLIHRDIKPENILLDARKEVLLSDFGIAVVSSSSISSDTKEMAGTIAYMAPEQIMGKPRPASDQYALGVVVYEWLCGELPFSGTFIETCTQHLYAPPPSLRAKKPEISRALEKIVFKALSKEAEQRFASIQDFADALEECVKPSIPHYYSTIRLPFAAFRAHSRTSSLNGATVKEVFAARRRLLWLCIIGICLLIGTLPLFAPALLQRVTTRTPALISLSAHTYQPPKIKSQGATPASSQRSHHVLTVASTPSSTTPTPDITPTSTLSPATTKATPDSSKGRQVVASPAPTTAPPATPSPTPASSLQLQVTPASLTPQVCSERSGYWECNVTLTTSGADSGMLRWSMAPSGSMGGAILHGRLMAGENRPVMIYIPNDPFSNNCISTSLVFSSSANTVTVPWTCPYP